MKESAKENNTNNCQNNELTSAFEKFNQSSQKLAELYSQLKKRVELIDKEMDEKNRELKEKVEESYRMTQYMDSILESMHSGVIAVDMECRVTTFNKAAQKILGIKKEETMGRPYEFVMICPSERKSFIRKALGGKRDFINFKREVLRSDNKAIWIESSVTLLKEKDGGVIGAMEVFKDLSEIKSLENRLEEAGDLASIGEMTASIAHEIRNPLNGIKGFAALLENGFNETDPRKKFVGHIVRGVENLNYMVTDLLVLAKPIKPNLKEYDIGELLAEVISFARQDMDNTNNRANIKIDFDRKPVLLNCDRYLLYQAFFNLIKNSFQAIPYDGGRVFVDINPVLNGERGNGKVEISISDNGVGMNKDVQSKIFEPFFTTKSGGTGLGLSLVQKIIRLHNGQIKVESQPGTGATFRIFLPKTIGKR